MSDLEAALAAHLNGKFFWEHTEMLDEASTPSEVAAVRKAQKKFANGARNITARNKNIGNLNSGRPLKKVLKEEQAILEPLIKAICVAYDISPDDLLGSGRTYQVTKPRKHFYWSVSRYFPSISLSQVGRLLNKDHSTVLHGKRSFEEECNIEMIGFVDELMGHK